MAEHPNVVVVRAAWQAVANSDIEALRELWSKDIVWHATGPTPWKGKHSGFDAVLDYLAHIGESGETIDVRLEDMMVSKQRVSILMQMRLEHGQRKLDVPYLLLVRLEKGQLVEIWSAPMDPDAVAEFWAPNA